ncbi:MAG: ComF family protein [Desulfobacterales bacterium]|nr:ComF family protein [Desulfobacterales bacterium]
MLKRFFGAIIDIIYPRTCLSCNKALGENPVDEIICRKCWNSIRLNNYPFCLKCGRHIEEANVSLNSCPACRAQNLCFDRAYSACIYEGAIKKLIHALKYSEKEHLGASLSRLLIDFIREFKLKISEIDLLIPIPLHKSRLREREFNQSEILAGYIAREFKKTLSVESLSRRHRTRPQADLSFDKRLSNVKNSFIVDKKEMIFKKNILLIDDVFTTGSTCSDAARALKEAGAKKVIVLTLAN